jgi:predicted dehydrogenase
LFDSNSTVRIGLLGTGPWARMAHGAAIAAHPDAELTGVWGRDPAKAQAVAQPLGAPVFDDADALIAASDAVAICLPPHVQAPLAVRAAEAGRHLLLEKPLALSVADADRIVAAVDAAGVRALVFHTTHFTPENDAWLAEVRRTNDWHGAHVTLLASIFEEPGNPFGDSPWRREQGALWDVGPHALDMVLSTLGPVDALQAARGRGDTVHVVLHHPTGASSTLTLSLTAPPAAMRSDWWVYGPRGVLTRPDGPTPPEQAFGRAISALISGDPHESDVRHGREIVAILERAQAALDG